jgi:hypothetical protein
MMGDVSHLLERSMRVKRKLITDSRSSAYGEDECPKFEYAQDSQDI